MKHSPVIKNWLVWTVFRRRASLINDNQLSKIFQTFLYSPSESILNYPVSAVSQAYVSHQINVINFESSGKTTVLRSTFRLYLKSPERFPLAMWSDENRFKWIKWCLQSVKYLPLLRLQHPTDFLVAIIIYFWYYFVKRESFLYTKILTVEWRRLSNIII